MANLTRASVATPETTIHVRLLGPVSDPDSLSMRRYASELTEALANNDGIRATRALAGGGGETVSARVTRRRSRATRTLGRLRHRARQLVRPLVVRRIDGDVFHVIDQRDARLIESLPADRTVQTVHDLGIPEPGRVDRGREHLAGWLAKAGHVVAISETTREEILAHTDVDPARVSVIPNGLNGHFRVIPPARLGAIHERLPSSQYRVLHVVSSSQARKNIAATIRVLHALRRQGLDAILVRAGAPLPEAEQHLAAELGVTDAIANCGYVSDERLVELYNASDAMLFPSTYEGFGWPPLEAMACGLPVVASNAASLPEVLGPSADAQGRGGAALLADPHDIEALTAYVAAVLTDAELAERLRSAGHARAGLFSWKRTASAYVELYRTLAAS